jgi:hypothetical protein
MARGIGMSGRRRSQMLDAIIGELEDAGYVLPAQKISDIRESEWDLGQDHASMSAESVGHLAAFIRDRAANGRLPIIVHQSGHVGLDWDDRLGRRLLLTFLDDGQVQYEASMPNPAASGFRADSNDRRLGVGDGGFLNSPSDDQSHSCAPNTAPSGPRRRTCPWHCRAPHLSPIPRTNPSWQNGSIWSESALDHGPITRTFSFKYPLAAQTGLRNDSMI